jgi:hypothetical protein
MLGPESRVATGPAIDYLVIGRLKPGLTAGDGQAAFNQFAGAAGEIAPNSWPTRKEVEVVPLADEVMGETVVTLRLLKYALVAGWVIAIVNIAALLVGRVHERRMEFWTRAALGGSRLDLCRPIVSEGMLLAATSFGCGLAAAVLGVNAVASLFPGTYNAAVSPALSWPMVGVVATLAVSTGLSASLPSLWLVLRRQGRSRPTAGTALMGRQWLPLLPPVLQVALTVALVAAVATLSLTMRRLLTVDLGFDARGVEVLSLTVPPSSTQPDQARVFGELITKAAIFPNVTAVGATSLLPLSGEDAIALLADVKGVRPIRGGFKDRFALTLIATLAVRSNVVCLEPGSRKRKTARRTLR